MDLESSLENLFSNEQSESSEEEASESNKSSAVEEDDGEDEISNGAVDFQPTTQDVKIALQNVLNYGTDTSIDLFELELTDDFQDGRAPVAAPRPRVEHSKPTIPSQNYAKENPVLL